MMRKSWMAVVAGAVLIAMCVTALPSRVGAVPIRWWNPDDQIGEPGPPGSGRVVQVFDFFIVTSSFSPFSAVIVLGVASQVPPQTRARPGATHE